ncbi:hypothetical protein E2F43_18200 [Seongchinamella unica]|uniref:Uncharacterized protein n=1 Tax=Seongchinamella unica TaxID=2547392 RepID=A0A4R5LN49_9GAMM|nr:hypothetical protein [Seongchinamella unica]TDG11643.1 hypothetical protein E2F43_18200 [Seongchinamella unica]
MNEKDQIAVAVALRAQGSTYGQIGHKLKISPVKARKLVLEGGEPEPDKLKIFTDLGMSKPTARRLAADYSSPEDVRQASDEELLKLPGFGKGSLADARKALGQIVGDSTASPTAESFKLIEKTLNIWISRAKNYAHEFPDEFSKLSDQMLETSQRIDKILAE